MKPSTRALLRAQPPCCGAKGLSIFYQVMYKMSKPLEYTTCRRIWYDRGMKKLGIYIAIAMAAVLAVLSPQVASAGVNDFTFKDFVGDYYLSRDNEGRSTLKVVETFTAEFPEDKDQNKGVVRAIPDVYDKHPTSFQFESLTRNGKEEAVYSQEKRGNDIAISTGTEEYLRGDQTYVLTYTLRDVTKSFGNHQEFYWDTVGTSSPQPFGKVTGRVHLDDTTRNLFADDSVCYEGGFRSDKECRVSQSGDVITFTSNGELPARQNVSMVLKFKEGAFEPYKEGALDAFMNTYTPILAVGLGVASIIAMFVARRTRGKDELGRGTIVPEYLPPKDISVLQSAAVVSGARAELPAQFIDLAVRHNIQIIETETKKSWFGGEKHVYKLKLLTVTGLTADEKKVVTTLFGASAKEGSTYTLDAADQKTGAKLHKLVYETKIASAISEGYRKKVKAAKLPIVLAFLSLAAAVVVFIWQTKDGREPGVSAMLVVPLFFVVVFVTIMALSMRPLTKKGSEMKEYLEGLKMYIKLAEADRLKVLQSPQGAQKTKVDTNDTEQVVRLYERVLPYAILFGLEKDWAKVLEVSYNDSGTDPSWYSGQNAFNGAMIGSAISNFSTTTSATFISSDGNSSGSGFSGGGGYSGGGGGGGSFGGR